MQFFFKFHARGLIVILPGSTMIAPTTSALLRTWRRHREVSSSLFKWGFHHWMAGLVYNSVADPDPDPVFLGHPDPDPLSTKRHL